MLYLAYGSNMSSIRLRNRVPSARSIGLASLPGWQLRFHKRSHDGSGKCNIVRSAEPEAIVYGVIFEIASKEKQRLDEIEGAGFGYRCEDVQVLFGTEAPDASTYVAGSSYLDDSLLPYAWYLDFVLVGAMEHDLPRDYVDRLRATPVCADPDSERDVQNRKLLAPE